MKMSFAIISVLSVITLIISLGHFVVYQAVVTFFTVKSPVTLSLLRIVTIFLSISFVAVSVIAMFGYSKVTNILYTASALWLGTFFWLLVASLCGALILVFARYAGVEGSWPLVVGQVLLCVAFGVSVYGALNTQRIQITRYTVPLANLPTEWREKKIAMVADLHLGNVYGESFSNKVARIIASEKPEAVLIPGDFYDGPPSQFKALAQPFGSLETKYGTFFATGNHESYREMSVYTDALSSSGVHVIDDKMVTLDGLQIIGLSYPSATNGEVQKKVLESLRVDRLKPSILLKHVPQGMDGPAEIGISLQVSGHTHYGQIWPFSFVTKSMFGPYAYGQYLFKDMDVITTSGVGTWGPPQRIGTKSEIVIITLINKE